MANLGVWKANIFATEAAAYRARGYEIGVPHATESLSADALGAHGMVGIYLPEGAADPGLEHGGLYFETVEPDAPQPTPEHRERKAPGRRRKTDQ